MAKVVKCPTEYQDGSRCDFMLQPEFAGCPMCLQPVNPEWFRESPSQETVGAPNQDVTSDATSQDPNTSPDKNGNSQSNNGGLSTPQDPNTPSDRNGNSGLSENGNPVSQSVSGAPSAEDAGSSVDKDNFGKGNDDKGGASNTNGTQTNGSSKPKQKTTKVGFHAFLAPTVDFNSNKDRLFVLFGPERDNWDCRSEGLMKLLDNKRRKNHHGLQVFAEVELEKELLKNGLSYKYCFQKKASEKVSTENEFLFQQYYPFHNSRRIIRISPDIDSYQQYDGFIYAKKGGYVVNLFKNVFGISNSSMIDTMKIDGEYALRNYLPNIRKTIELPNQEPSVMMQTFNDYAQVFKGGIKDHFMESRHNYGPKIWQEFIMTDHLRDTIQMLDIESNKEDENHRILKALLIVALLCDLDISHDLLDNSLVEIIHRALLLLPDTQMRTCEQLDFLKSVMQPSMKLHMRQGLVWFLKKTAHNTEDRTERNPSWISCIPIVQFLGGSLHPFQELDFENFHDKDRKWWSLDEFENEKEELKTRKWSRSLPEMMTVLKPLFELDTKTQRSFMACLNWNDLALAMKEESILLEIKLATMQHFFEVLEYSRQMEILGNCTMTLCQLYEDLLNKLPSDMTKREWNAVDNRFKVQQDKCVAILSTGMQKSYRIPHNKTMLVSLFHCNMLSLAVLERVSTDSDELKSLQKRATYLIDDILLEIGKDFGVYEFALSILRIVMETELTKEWERKCLLHAKRTFESINARKRLEFYYSESMKALQTDSLRDVFHGVVMESIDEILQDTHIYSFLNDARFTWSGDWYTARFLSGIFSQMWKIELNASENSFIRDALNSPVYPKCVEACLHKTKVFEDMDPAAKQKLTHSISIMTSLFEKLSSNAVPIVQLELICSRRETFIAVACVFEKYEDKSIPLTSSALENLLLCREKDLKCLEEVIGTVEKLQFLFKEICENTNIRVHQIDEDTLRNWKFKEVGRVCKMPEQSVGWSQYQPEVSLFRDLLSSLGAFVTNIYFYNDSKSFHKILKIVARKYKLTQDFGFDDVRDKILLHTQGIWDELCVKIKEGTISVSEIEKYRFNDFTDEQLHTEFVAMNRGQKPHWIGERITQLHRFRQFSKTVAVAKLMVDVREKYDIKGSFQNLELIANSETEKEIPLKDLKLSIEDFNEKLAKINTKQKESISSLLRCNDLVQWLRSALPGGVKDLKIYADLALLSVEGDEQVGRVTSLHSATIGYSPMIFRIEDINGEMEMLERWSEVWQSLEKDDDLPRKLELSNRLLHWFMEIKESHGSVEVTSLKQVDAIKDRGIFKVGHSIGKAVKNKHQLELADVIWLHVPGAKIVEITEESELDNSDADPSDSEIEIKERDTEVEIKEEYRPLDSEVEVEEVDIPLDSEMAKDEQDIPLRCIKRERQRGEGRERQRGEGRDYTLGEMTDLQSRLMLVTGKADAGRESIERFTSIFDNVTRLGKVFIQLHASGCILFKRWTFEFHCNQNAGSSVLIKTHEQSVVKGTNYPQVHSDAKDTESNVNEYIRSIADFMESCYEEWIKYIRDKRNTFYPLNFYTVDQMVLLQEELALYRNGHVGPKYLCPLLSLVKSRCSLNPDVEDAINKVQERLLTREQTSHMEETTDKTSHAEAIQRFLKVCEEASISRKHALRAIKSQEFDIEDSDAGLLWCLTNDEDEDDEEETPQDPVTERDNSMQNNSTIGDKLREFMEDLEEKIRQQEIDQVILNLDQTWKKFLDCASSSATDFLSIDHLGMILEVLYQTESCILKRPLIDPLKSGKPNLIVCPQSEVISMMLTIYMTDPVLPLPTRNEVLLCTESTTKEEVSIFFRRALFQNESDPNERIFCLMNADMLQYDASEQSLKEVTEYVKSAKGDYKLVIICGSENEYKSPMISALDRFRAPKIAPATTAKIQEYLRRKYSVEDTSDTAAAVDPSGLCVRVVKSERAGMGKTLYKIRMVERLLENNPIGAGEDFPMSITIPMSQEKVDVSEVSKKFLDCTPEDGFVYPRIIHIDIAYGVEKFVGTILFNILILGSTVDESGYVFHRSEKDLYIVETTLNNDSEQDKRFVSSLQLLNILPSVTCIPPEESDTTGSRNEATRTSELLVGFDPQNFQSDEYQRPLHYLKNYVDKSTNIPVFNTHKKEEDMKNCLRVLIRHCCVTNPSWAELRNFVHFLNTQLKDFEKSVYCGAALSQDLPGFPSFVLRFLIQMSKDFSTRSLDISEGKTNGHSDEDQADDSSYAADDDIGRFQMRRRWETSAHPYLFFNPDQHTMTFIGFNIDKYHRNLVDQQTGSTLERNIMSAQLWEALRRNHVPLQENFDDLSRSQKIERLCRVFGNEMPQDPDETYELTTDNVKKMLAIYMRFRCNIPVIVMGETGCGKTCLIKFLCSLQCPAGLENQMNTMTLMKVHGGTKKKHIIEKVKQAESLAQSNCEKHGKHIITVLFFDEANTTEAVGCIKEIMCDGTIDGEPLAINTNLKLVAACNPYRKHSEEMIERLERAGLGYHVNAHETDDRLGRIPMRHLVYRVQPLPQSMLPLVWDFGQLDHTVEKLYIVQMVQRCVRNGTLPFMNRQTIHTVSNILAASQDFMRKQKDECSFVSLRDVERTLKVFGWLYKQNEIFTAMNQLDEDDETFEEEEEVPEISQMTRSLLLALGVCYHSSLKSREEYRDFIVGYFEPPFKLSGGQKQMEREITRCQMSFLQNLKLNDNIAKNLALRENFFMMVVCVELRIPLFLVGKPGSSKSLSKTILDHNMQGRDSQSRLFRSLKQVQLISFQCSPLATADGILKTFKQASSFQRSKDLDRFVSVVVLDEVGLAEDSPRMPLKALHPLLEDGCPDDEEFEDYKKVSFIGISNWALDPAKMNRGILVQREVPNEPDLVESARGICQYDEKIYPHIADLVPLLAKGYLHVFEKACESEALFGNSAEDHLKAREFFGLRDFYSLVKMICAIASKNHRSPNEQELAIAIKRNFGGLEGLDPVQDFGKFLPILLESRHVFQNIETDTALLRECLKYDENKMESRYILLLTENYGALNLLHQLMGNEKNTHVIFGSSFPRDQEYIEICRNINRIKVFMETGKTVVLLNLENLYESLYDALNQYYMESGPDRYIDLGLGTHRVKCKVDKKFRLIVVAEKRMVYREFPIPLINRLEKHFLTMEGMLTETQLRLSRDLERWAKEFSNNSDRNVRLEEVFIGYNKDTAAGVILKAWDACNKKRSDDNFSFRNRVLETAKDILLWGSTPDAVLRLKNSTLQIHAEEYFQKYFRVQCHESLCDFLTYRHENEQFGGNFIQITTHSKLLSVEDKRTIERNLPFLSGKVSLLSLQAFDTEHQFSCQIRDTSEKGNKLLLVQCDTGGENSSLVECARYCVQREIRSAGWDVCVVFLVHLSRVSKTFFSGFQTGLWTSVHIDELRSTSLPSISDLMTKTISSILLESLSSRENFAEVAEDESIRPIVKQEHQLNLRAILFNCIHPALASIKELDDGEGRSIGRIKFIFKELNRNQQLLEGHFAHGLMKHIVSMLSTHDTEKIHPGDTWIHSEAATPASVNKTGTLRSSCQKVIEEKVTPLLAKIIAYVDTDNNISLLEKADDEANWVTNLWLGIFTSIDGEAVNKMKVPRMQSMGAGHSFSAKFPFSWLIYETVEKFLIVTSENEIGKTAEQLFLESDIGMCVMKHVDPENIAAATRLYLSDFVHISHKTHSEREEMIICESIHICFEESMVGKEDHFASRILCIHDSFRKIKPKLETFSKVLCLVSDSNDAFFQKVQGDCKELDIAAIRYLLDAMEPNEMAIDTAEGQIIWIQNVQRYRPVIERLLHGHDKEQTTHRGRLMAVIRTKWTKVVVLKLFIQNLCVETSREKLMAQTCKILWKIMGDSTNFKEKPTLDKLEKFLKASNSKAMSEFLGKFGKCNHCGKSFDSSPPVVLPCDHRICREDCFSLINALSEEDKACPVNKCSRKIPEEFDENETPENQKKQMKLFTEYQEKCNKFYLQVVSQLCFEDFSPPSEEVCQHLLQLVMHKKEIPQLNMTIIRTRHMTIFETVVDTTPVFRSFLLQLLIQTNEEVVFQHLEEFLREANAIFQQRGNTNHVLELCLMLNQCIEDSLLEQLFYLNPDREKQIERVDSLLSDAIVNLQSSSGVIDKIRSIATARCCLQITAKYLKECYSSKSETDRGVYEGVFRKASMLCQLPVEHIRIFLLTHICRSYGLDLYQCLLRSNETWLFSCDKAKNLMEECPDYCIVLGDTYTETREHVAETLLVKKDSIDLKITERSVSAQIVYLLALLKEVKFRDISSNVGDDITSQFITGLKREFARQNMQIVLSFLDGILEDSFAKSCKQFQIGYHRNIRDQGIIVLLLHLLMIVKTLSANEILQPLIHLATQPQTMKGSFLPTMPEECLSQEIKAELQRMEEIANKNHHTVTWYRCPNGHPYAVGDCGNPTQLGRCYQCKAEIGGESSMRKDNVKDTGSDFSQPGHILGSPDGRITQAFTERTLSPSSNALLRLVTHMAMFIGANDHIDDICSLIQPSIPTGMVPDFLWEHMNKDIDTIGNALDCSVDQVFMFLHSMIHSFVETDNSYSGIVRRVSLNKMYSLSTKEGRQKWERDIDEKFLTKKLQTHQEFLEHCGQILSNDKSIGSDPFLKLVFTKERTPDNEFTTSDMQLSSSMWQYRMRVSFEHFAHEFHVQKNKRIRFHNPYVVLDTFLQQECFLRHISHIPKVLLMQKLLITKFGKQITREEADRITMQDCIALFLNDPSQESIARGLSSFCELWNNARHLYAFTLFCGGSDELRDLLKRNISPETDSVRVVLPDTQGIGKCSRLLLEFFIGKQNDFVTACGSAIDPRFDGTKKLTVDNLTTMHFISFKRETDIFPIILANCNYTYMPDESTKLEYDYENIQAVLQDRILFGKPIVDTSMGFPVMMYKADASVSLKFSSLTTKIQQEALNRAAQSEIALEFSDLPELYETIGNLDTVMNFLMSVNYPADISLNSFMEETLQMKPLPSQKAVQCCKLCHVQSLWFVLTLEKTKRLHHSEKEAFDGINRSIQEALSDEQMQELDSYLNELSLEKLQIFLEQLLEFMLFSLNCGEGDIGSYQYSLMESFMVHLEDPVYSDTDLKSFRPDDIQRLPVSIRSEHSVEVWKRIHRFILSRE